MAWELLAITVANTGVEDEGNHVRVPFTVNNKDLKQYSFIITLIMKPEIPLGSNMKVIFSCKSCALEMSTMFELNVSLTRTSGVRLFTEQ